jgi:pimeloyl-ACP methyl ester carboxylesterase
MLVSRLMNARIEGDAEDTIVLAHGFGSDQSVWDRIVPPLKARMRVVRFDLACSGSAAPEAFDLRRHSTLGGYAEDILDVVRDLGIERFVFVGHSMSAIAGLMAAIERPQKFERLVLIGASPRYVSEPGYEGGFGQSDLTAVFEAIATDFKSWAKQFAPIIVARPPEDSSARSFTESMRRMRPDIALAAWQAVVKTDVRDRLAACRVPTVLLQTARDPSVPTAAAEYLHSHIPGSTLEIVDTEGHLPHLTSPDLVLAALRRHIPQLG